MHADYISKRETPTARQTATASHQPQMGLVPSKMPTCGQVQVLLLAEDVPVGIQTQQMTVGDQSLQELAQVVAVATAQVVLLAVMAVLRIIIAFTNLLRDHRP